MSLARKSTKQHQSVSKRRERFCPTFECLEGRLVPVVGAIQAAQVVDPGATAYDGVAKIGPDGAFATASVMGTQRHVLTAAHVVGLGDNPFSATDITFQLKRTVPNAIEINIPIPVQANIGGARPQTFQFVPGGQGAPAVPNADDAWSRNSFFVNDIAVVSLTDPRNPGQSNFLVAPKGAPNPSNFSRDRC